MKIVAVLGSPRVQGNSTTLAQVFLKAAREQGAETQEFVLNQLDFKGCQGCGACKTKQETCILEDDLTQVLDAIRAADIVVLASPVYFGDVSGQMKSFFDRTYSYITPDFTCRLPGGKKAVLVLTQAATADNFVDIFPRYERWLKMYGCDPVHLLRATGVKDLGAITGQAAILDEAAVLARELVQP
jgi:multimeric flavodoxin WrbA